MPSERNDTKERILEAAKRLFAEKGFNGTSVREIADLSESNISAINYHFSSKQGLYWSLLFEAFQWLENGIKEICSDAESIEEVITRIFEFLTNDPSYLRSTMKSLLADTELAPPTSHQLSDALTTSPGMPGYNYLAAFIRSRLGESPSEKSIFWAVNSIFSSTIHMALMSTTPKFKLKYDAVLECSSDFCIRQLVHLGRSALIYARTERDALERDIIFPVIVESDSKA